MTMTMRLAMTRVDTAMAATMPGGTMPIAAVPVGSTSTLPRPASGIGGGMRAEMSCARRREATTSRARTISHGMSRRVRRRGGRLRPITPVTATATTLMAATATMLIGRDRDDAVNRDRDDAVNRDRDDSHESWTEQRLRAYLPQMRESPGYRSGGLNEQSESSGDLANDARWSQMRDGDRWAEVRSDDRGRELRMAERREERHVDETGTQLRIVDRWSSVREERIPPAAHHAPPRETRAERRRRAEHDESDGMYPAAAPRAELPRPRPSPEDRAERPSGEVGRGWRDVRSGVIEPDHSDRYETSRYDGPSRDRPSRDMPARDRRPPESPSRDPHSHDDVGIYRRRSDDRSASGRPAPDERSDDPYASGWVDDRATSAGAARIPPARSRDSGEFPPARRNPDSGDIPPARSRDSGDFPPARRAESAAFEERDDRWVREPGQRSGGRRPQLDFEVTDDRWN